MCFFLLMRYYVSTTTPDAVMRPSSLNSPSQVSDLKVSLINLFQFLICICSYLICIISRDFIIHYSWFHSDLLYQVNLRPKCEFSYLGIETYIPRAFIKPFSCFLSKFVFETWQKLFACIHCLHWHSSLSLLHPDWSELHIYTNNHLNNQVSMYLLETI